MLMRFKPEILTGEAFAPYGRLIDSPTNRYTKEGEGWQCFSPIDFMITDAPLGVGVVYCQFPPKAITALERHVSREELLWATGQDLVMAVDLPICLGDENAEPNIHTTKVFLIMAGQCVIINRGTWHSPAFAVNGDGKYYFLVEQKSDLVNQDAQPWIPFSNNESAVVDM